MQSPAEILRMPMTATEARQAVMGINSRLAEARTLLLDLYERRGWEALGYSSWRECAEAEFGESQRFLYYQLQAAQIETVLHNCAKPAGVIPEGQLRPLAPLRDEPDKLRAAWSLANERTNGKPTGRAVQDAVDEVIARSDPEEDDESPAPPAATPSAMAGERWARIFAEYADLANSVNRRGGLRRLASDWPTEKIRRSEGACRTVMESFTRYLDDIRELLRCRDKA